MIFEKLVIQCWYDQADDGLEMEAPRVGEAYEYQLKSTTVWVHESAAPLWLVRQYEQQVRIGAGGEYDGELYCFCQTPWDADRPMIGYVAPALRCLCLRMLMQYCYGYRTDKKKLRK